MKTRNFCWMKDWKPRLCRTIQEIHSVLEENGIFNKKIKSFRAIGMARNLDFYQNLLRGGFKKEKILSGRISHFKDSFFPVEAELCEPFFIVFEDNSTLEIMPCNTEHGLLVGTNQIPHNTKDGLNHSNFRPQKFFKPLCGTTIESVAITNTTHKTTTIDDEYEYKDTVYKFALDLPCETRRKYGSFKLEIGQSCGVYTVRLTLRKKLGFSQIMKIALPIEQIPIADGHHGSGFWIYPIKYNNEKKDVDINRNTDEISIDETYMPILVPFLVKYFDKTHPYYKHQIPTELFNGFNWYCWHNLYTYEDMRKMLADIKSCAYMLENDFDNPALKDVKDHIGLFELNYFDGRFYPDITEEEKNEIRRSKIHIATDFYRRFAYRMEVMLQRSTKYNLITFEGP